MEIRDDKVEFLCLCVKEDNFTISTITNHLEFWNFEFPKHPNVGIKIQNLLFSLVVVKENTTKMLKTR